MLSDDLRRTVADALRDAERDRSPISPLRETWPEIDVVDSYEIQLLNIRRRMSSINSAPNRVESSENPITRYWSPTSL